MDRAAARSAGDLAAAREEIARVRAGADAGGGAALEVARLQWSAERAQLVREADTLRDLQATQERLRREDMSRLLEENSTLKARIAADAAALANPGAGGAISGMRTYFTSPSGGGGGWTDALPAPLARLEARHPGSLAIGVALTLAAALLFLRIL